MSSIAPKTSAIESRSTESVIIRAQGISKTYRIGDEDLTILKHADFSVRRGEFVAIEGRSGSGKSTLLHILGGLDSPTTGTVEFQNVGYNSRPTGLLQAPVVRLLGKVSPLTRMSAYVVGIVLALASLVLITALHPPLAVNDPTTSITLVPQNNTGGVGIAVAAIVPGGPMEKAYGLKENDFIGDLLDPGHMREGSITVAATSVLRDKYSDGKPLKVRRDGDDIVLVKQSTWNQLSYQIPQVIRYIRETPSVSSGTTFLTILSVLIIAITLYLRWEGRLLLFFALWVCADLLALLCLGSYPVLVAAITGGVIAAVCLLATINTYVAESPICRLRNKEFGFVFQFYHLLPELNVLENTLVSPLVEKSWFGYIREKQERVVRATGLLEELGLSHRLRHKPNQLSGGERQRVAIARALMNSPKVLFADEPTGNLDYETGRQIMGVLEKLHQEKRQTIVMVTHDRSLAGEADRVLVLRNGRLERPGENAKSEI